MPPDQFEALKADISERGVLTPIDVDEQGFILDGHHRYRACCELGIEDFPTIVRPALTEADKRMFARKANMLRRHLTRAQLRQIISDQLRDTPEWANNRIAQELGADSKTVQSVRQRLEATSEIPKFEKLIGADGKARTLKRKPAVMVNSMEELRKVLQRIEDGSDVDSLDGFGLGAISLGSVDYWTDLTDDEIEEWDLFVAFLKERCGYSGESAGEHADWLRRREYKTPCEWLEDDAYRARVGLKQPSRKFIQAWERFLQHRGDVSAEQAAA
jgi:hypothetical protein